MPNVKQAMNCVDRIHGETCTESLGSPCYFPTLIPKSVRWVLGRCLNLNVYILFEAGGILDFSYNAAYIMLKFLTPVYSSFFS